MVESAQLFNTGTALSALHLGFRRAGQAMALSIHVTAQA
jgi:hypothetical protein